MNHLKPWCLLLQHWQDVLQEYSPSEPKFLNASKRWILVLLTQLWKIAWDLCHYWNGALYQAKLLAEDKLLRFQVHEEHAKD